MKARVVIDVWRKIVIVIASLMLVAGLGLFMFPIVSNFIGTQISNAETESFESQASNVVENMSFEEAVEKGVVDKESYPIDEEGKRTSDTRVVFDVDIKRLYEDSLEYNAELKNNQSANMVGEDAFSKPVLDLQSYGIMDEIYGYVSAPSIGMKLPIYLGASESNMSYGVGHMTYTSLPIGGTDTNTVLAGHTGYIGRVFFDNLRNLNIGDTVTLRNYWTNLEYQVVSTKICKPDEAEEVLIKDGKDLLTMITCISDNEGGFDRYYVICERVNGG